MCVDLRKQYRRRKHKILHTLIVKYYYDTLIVRLWEGLGRGDMLQSWGSFLLFPGVCHPEFFSVIMCTLVTVVEFNCMGWNSAMTLEESALGKNFATCSTYCLENNIHVIIAIEPLTNNLRRKMHFHKFSGTSFISWLIWIKSQHFFLQKKTVHTYRVVLLLWVHFKTFSDNIVYITKKRRKSNFFNSGLCGHFIGLVIF